MTAIVSVPSAHARAVGYQLAPERSLPTQETDIGRTYIFIPLACLAGTGLFERADLDIQYFDTADDAMDWADHDIQRRRDDQRAAVREMVLAGLKQRGMPA